MQDRIPLDRAPSPPPAREINNRLPDPWLNKPRPDRLHTTEHSRHCREFPCALHGPMSHRWLISVRPYPLYRFGEHEETAHTVPLISVLVDVYTDFNNN